MLIELTYDVDLDLLCFVFGRYPVSLRNEIARQKSSIYQSLGLDLTREGFLSGTAEFEVDGRKFTADFSSDTWQDDPDADIRQLRVTGIEEHT